MARRRTVANPLALAVLVELITGPKHPYEMARWFKETGKDRHIKYNQGSLYMVVDQLTRAGFITEQKTVRDSERPERTLYAITAEGRRELYDWMRELVGHPQREYPLFLVALSLIAVLSPKETIELLEQRLGALAEEADAIRKGVRAASEQGVDWIYLIEEEYRLAVVKTEQRFVKELIGSLGKPEYVRTWNAWSKSLPKPKS